MSAIEVKPDMTLIEITEMLEAERGASFAPSSIWRFLDRHGVTYKKSAHAAEQDRPDVAAARQVGRELAPRLDPDKLAFIDETGASTKMARLYGRSKRGRRCRGAVPHARSRDHRHSPNIHAKRLAAA